MGEEKCKVVVFGAYNAGKSTFIRSLDPFSRHIEVKSDGGTTTVALDFGRVRMGQRVVYLFGTPGQERFEFARQILSRGMHGAVMVVDTTRDLDALTERQHRWLQESGIPYAIMLNKCDHPGSTPERFRSRFYRAPIYAVSALRPETVSDAFEAFVKEVLSPATIQ
ncbi:MAG: 50S ribosome-binding GTPase [Methanomicrobiales archaeon]|nr:50S ribosome-binding GTPase [Methanomicrobiales archaeon]